MENTVIWEARPGAQDVLLNCLCLWDYWNNDSIIKIAATNITEFLFVFAEN